MMDILASIDWAIDPIAFSIAGRSIAWYGVSWTIAVVLTIWVVNRTFVAEKRPKDWFETFALYIVASLFIGARLGHCFFYDPVTYLSNPIEILKIWEGGLASHGGAMGMLVGVCLFSIKVTKQKINWKLLGISAIVGLVAGRVGYSVFNTNEPFSIIDINNSVMIGSTIMGMFIGLCVALVYNSSPMCLEMLDRLALGVCIGAATIRIGNFMNSEIYGGHTTLPWGVNFIKDPSWYAAGSLPSHPTQLYEALMCLCVFALVMFLYWRTDAKERKGLIIGVSLLIVFSGRFIIESIKNVQVDFEQNMLLNMGQILSIPFVLWGIWLIYNAMKQNKRVIIKQQ